MRIVIAGGHGQIARRLAHALVQRGNSPVGLIRNPDHASDLRENGTEPIVCDLEKVSLAEVARHVDGSAAVVFAAGAGPGSGVERKTTVDRDAAVLLADAAEAAGVSRYIMISAMRVDDPPQAGVDPVFAAYLRAKAEADADIRARQNLKWTIVRPGRLTSVDGSGLVSLGGSTSYGDVPRDDVAAVVAALLMAPRTSGMTMNLVAGSTPIPQAVENLLTS